MLPLWRLLMVFVLQFPHWLCFVEILILIFCWTCILLIPCITTRYLWSLCFYLQFASGPLHILHFHPLIYLTWQELDSDLGWTAVFTRLTLFSVDLNTTFQILYSWVPTLHSIILILAYYHLIIPHLVLRAASFISNTHRTFFAKIWAVILLCLRFYFFPLAKQKDIISWTLNLIIGVMLYILPLVFTRSLIHLVLFFSPLFTIV